MQYELTWENDVKRLECGFCSHIRSIPKSAVTSDETKAFNYKKKKKISI